MVGRISTAGVNLHTLLSIQRNKELSNIYTNQMTTGYKYQRLQDYGTDTKRILDYENIITERQGYMRAIDLVDGITSTYEEALAQMADVASQIMTATDPLSVQREEFPGETDTFAQNYMVEIEANLNIEIGGRYIFAGTNFTEAPAIDMRTLEVYSMYDATFSDELIDLGVLPTDSYVIGEDDGSGGLTLSAPILFGEGDTLETADIVPQTSYKRPLLDNNGDLQYDTSGNIILEEFHQSYSSKFAGDQTTDSRSWTQMSLTIHDQQNYPYSVSSNEGAFQMLNEALLRMRSSTQTFVDDEFDNWEIQRGFLREAYALAEKARTEIRKLEVRNGAAMTEFSEARDFHSRLVSLAQVSRDNLRNADDTEAAINLSALNTQIEASYTTISKRSELTLTRFL